VRRVAVVVVDAVVGLVAGRGERVGMGWEQRTRMTGRGRWSGEQRQLVGIVEEIENVRWWPRGEEAGMKQVHPLGRDCAFHLS